MDSQTCRRPTLRPIWTGYSSHPRTNFRAAPSPMALANTLATATPSSPMSSRPSPMHPAPSGYDPALQKHDRALLESLGPRAGPPCQQPALSVPMAEQQPLGAELGTGLGTGLGAGLGTRTRATPRSQVRDARRRTIAAETRSILLSGLPSTQSDVSTPVDRRPSLPVPLATSSLAAAALRNARRGSQVAARDRLRSQGHVWLGDGSTADCFVSAVALRRPSLGSSSDEQAEPKKESDSGRLVVRARVRPLDRKAFLLQRTFDLDALRSTIPDASPTPTTPGLGNRRLLPASRGMPKDARSLLARSPKGFVRGTNVVPMHVPYARLHLPVLAALMLSGHIRKGDVVDLPVPHPEAWVQTVAYVYTGQGEMTEAMKQNIVYLAGKVPN